MCVLQELDGTLRVKTLCILQELDGTLRVKTLCILQELDEAEKSYKAGDMSTSGDSETSIPDVQEQDDDGKTETRTGSRWGAIANPRAKVFDPSSTPKSHPWVMTPATESKFCSICFQYFICKKLV